MHRSSRRTTQSADGSVDRTIHRTDNRDRNDRPTPHERQMTCGIDRAPSRSPDAGLTDDGLLMEVRRRQPPLSKRWLRHRTPKMLRIEWSRISGELYLDLVAGRGARRQRARAPARHLFARPLCGVVGNGEEMHHDFALRLPPQPATIPA